MAKMERPAPWPDPPEKVAGPKPSWSGRKFRRRPEIIEAVQSSSGLWEILGSDLGVEDRFLYDDEEFRTRFEPVTAEETEV
ncbi:MAG: hypothetical protein NTY36_01305 [Deltaproteobacteria bacterium]|nr:hypothetical protein [Deltaproteobacteria bacterium]